MQMAMEEGKMTREYTVTEARNHLSRVIQAAETGGPVRITRHGKVAAVLLAEGRFREAPSVRPGFWVAYQTFRGTEDPDGAGLGRSDLNALRDRTPGRDLDL